MPSRGVYMTDGIMNVALLNFRRRADRGLRGPKECVRPDPLRMWVDDLDAIDKTITAAAGAI